MRIFAQTDMRGGEPEKIFSWSSKDICWRFSFGVAAVPVFLGVLTREKCRTSFGC